MLSATHNATHAKMHSIDRVLMLELEDGKSAVSTKGMVDNRLFTGENKLHARMDPQTILWSMKYEQGSVPPALKGQFTSFGKLYQHASEYFKKRNIKITQVVD